MTEAPKIKVSPPCSANRDYAPNRFRFIATAGETLSEAAAALIAAATAENVALILAALDQARWAIEETAGQLNAFGREAGDVDE
jgi:hypothetical protein